MKKTICLVLGLVLISNFAVSCSPGVPLDKYNRTTNELANTQKQIEKLQSDLAAKEQTLNTLNAKFADATKQFDLLYSIFVPALTGEYNYATEAEMEKFMGELDVKVGALEDTVLTAKYIEVQKGESSEVAMDFFQYILDKLAQAVQ